MSNPSGSCGNNTNDYCEDQSLNNVLTRPIKPDEIFPSQWGMVTGRQWCHLEAARNARGGVPTDVFTATNGRLFLVKQ